MVVAGMTEKTKSEKNKRVFPLNLRFKLDVEILQNLEKPWLQALYIILAYVTKISLLWKFFNYLILLR
jgi:hypothetical protein